MSDGENHTPAVTEAQQLVQAMLKAKAAEADRIALWQTIADKFGGMESFVQEMYDLYKECQKGSANKVRMGSMFLEIFADAAKVTKPVEPELALSEAELAAGLTHILQHGLPAVPQLDAT